MSVRKVTAPWLACVVKSPTRAVSPLPAGLQAGILFWAGTLFWAGIALVGCTPAGEKTYPVSGLVRFSDGRVLREGSVEFEVIGRTPPITATGVIAADGTFTLGTYESSDGAFPGRHRVAIFSDPIIGTGAERPGLIPESPLPPRFSSFDDSGIVLEVRSEDNQLIIEIDLDSQI